MHRNNFKIILLGLSVWSQSFLASANYGFVSDAVDMAGQVSDIGGIVDGISDVGDFGSVGSIADFGGGAVSGFDIDLGEISDAAGIGASVSDMASTVGINSAETEEPFDLLDEWTYASTTDTDFGEMMQCAEWQFIGICFSWRMTWVGPKFYNNTIVENYTRDMHIEVREGQPDEDAINGFISGGIGEPLDHKSPTDYWVGGMSAQMVGMMNGVLSPLSNLSDFSERDMEKNGVDAGTRNRDGHDYLFREVMVLGNSEVQMYDLFAGHVLNAVGWCSSPNMPYIPYYSSSFDWFSWRVMPSTEMAMYAPYLVQNGMTDIGDDFGGTMPRIGRIQTASPFKAAVVAAYRGMHLTAANESTYSALAGLHVVTPMMGFSPGSWSSNFYKTKQKTSTFKLEMVYPFQGEKCSDYKESAGWLSDPRELEFLEGNDFGSAAFKGYRPLRCCSRRGNHIVDIPIVPPRL